MLARLSVDGDVPVLRLRPVPTCQFGPCGPVAPTGPWGPGVLFAMTHCELLGSEYQTYSCPSPLPLAHHNDPTVGAEGAVSLIVTAVAACVLKYCNVTGFNAAVGSPDNTKAPVIVLPLCATYGVETSIVGGVVPLLIVRPGPV